MNVYLVAAVACLVAVGAAGIQGYRLGGDHVRAEYAEAAENAQRNIIDIASLIAADRRKVMAAKDGTVQAIRLFEMLPTMPRFTITFAAERLGVTFPTASAAVKVLQSVDVLAGTGNQKRNQQFSYKQYTELLQR